MLTKILIALAVIVVLMVLVVLLQPDDFRVARTAALSAPTPAIFAQVNDFRRWEAWSPWAKLDPAMKVTYEGAASGEGAGYRWSGNNEVGEGRSTIIESQPNERIRMKLEFVRPFAGTNDVEFTFKPDGEQTLVTWSMSGKKNFMCKAVGLFMNCEKMCGAQFEQGFASLRAIVETPDRDVRPRPAVQLSGSPRSL